MVGSRPGTVPRPGGQVIGRHALRRSYRSERWTQSWSVNDDGAVKRLVKKLVSRAVRYAAREFIDELARLNVSPKTVESVAPKPEHSSPRVRIDVEDALQQLGSRTSRARLNHFFTWNHRWVALLGERNRRAAESTYDFIDTSMGAAVFQSDQFDLLASRHDEIAELGGQILDLGVYKGSSTRALCRLFPDHTIHGFDSFEGLPDDWAHVLKGDFGDVEGALPQVPENGRLYKGWFDDTLPVWANEHAGEHISLLRVDCDIYSSTKTVFDELGGFLSAGAWVLFDELIGYRGWERHEHRAFQEFLATRPELGVEYVGYGLTYVLTRLTSAVDGA